jgi:hypothetical protein
MPDYNIPMKNSAIDRLTGFTRGEIRYRKLADKAEAAARASNVKKNMRLVDRANRLNNRKSLNEDKIAYM